MIFLNIINQFISENPIKIIIAYGIVAIFFFGIAKLENYKKPKVVNLKRNKLITMSLVLFVITIIILFLIIKSNIFPANTIIFLIVMLKAAYAIYVATEAKSLGRDSTIWFCLGFFEYHIALIILAISPKIYDKNNQSEIINNDYQSKLDSLNNLKNAKVVTEEEYSKKLKTLVTEFDQRMINSTRKKKLQIQSNKNIEKKNNLNIAYQKGVLTEEEYKKKLQELN